MEKRVTSQNSNTLLQRMSILSTMSDVSIENSRTREMKGSLSVFWKINVLNEKGHERMGFQYKKSIH